MPFLSTNTRASALNVSRVAIKVAEEFFGYSSESAWVPSRSPCRLPAEKRSGKSLQ
jgi:hypothetical protein